MYTMELYDIITPSILTESSVGYIDIISTCHDSITEGTATKDVLDIASTYTKSLVYEILDNVYNALLKLYQNVIYLLNNYILNSTTVLIKYQDVLKSRIDKVKEPIVFESYEYPDSKNYPNIIHSDSAIVANVYKLKTLADNPNFTSEMMALTTDDFLKQFSQEVIEDQVDTYDLRNSTREIVRAHILGKKVVQNVTSKEIDTFIDSIKSSKKDRDDVKSLKTSIVKDYEILKRSYKRVTDGMKQYTSSDMKNLYQPEQSAMVAHEYNRYANINTEVIRLYNGYITIYNEAFTTKLNLLRDRYQYNINIISQIMKATSLFASSNVERPGTINKPLKYEPSLKL